MSYEETQNRASPCLSWPFGTRPRRFAPRAVIRFARPFGAFASQARLLHFLWERWFHRDLPVFCHFAVGRPLLQENRLQAYPDGHRELLGFCLSLIARSSKLAAAFTT